MPLITRREIQQPLHVATPVRQSLALTKIAGSPVYLKLDSSQPTGSFKIRGIGHLCKAVSSSLCSGRKGGESLCGPVAVCQLQSQTQGGQDLTVISFIYLCFPCSGQSEDVSGLSAAQVGSQTNKNKKSQFQNFLWPLFYCVLSFDAFGPKRRKCWDGSSLFCPSPWGSCNYSSPKCYTNPNSGAAAGRGRHCDHSWQGEGAKYLGCAHEECDKQLSQTDYSTFAIDSFVLFCF